MTGYARSQGQDASLGWAWEVKSVNGRGLELRTRLPAGYDFLEMAAREAVQKRLKRGNVTLSLSVTRLKQAVSLTINESLLAQYAELAGVWSSRMPHLTPASIDGLLALRGVLDNDDSEDATTEIEGRAEAILASCHQTIDSLCAMRAAEGRRLATVLESQLAEVAALVTRAEGCAALDPEVIKARLRQQVQTLLDAVPALAEDRLAQEAALVAAKADIREELDRLKSHVAAARELLASGDAVGRRLDFLCQEFNREANTLCSKAGDVEMTGIGLMLKAVIEQFREQVQNIE
jgi:uncharacterized protein (TIGR00255 family)